MSPRAEAPTSPRRLLLHARPGLWPPLPPRPAVPQLGPRAALGGSWGRSPSAELQVPILAQLGRFREHPRQAPARRRERGTENGVKHLHAGACSARRPNVPVRGKQTVNGANPCSTQGSPTGLSPGQSLRPRASPRGMRRGLQEREWSPTRLPRAGGGRI